MHLLTARLVLGNWLMSIRAELANEEIPVAGLGREKPIPQ